MMSSKELELALRMATKAIRDLTVLREEIQTATLQGPAGSDGAHGKDGLNGRDGVNGKDGIQGTKGDLGPEGPEGVQGKAGRDGTDGADGGTPEHEVNMAGDSVRFQNPDGTWGRWIETTRGGGGGGDSGARPIHTYQESRQLNDLNYTVLGNALGKEIIFTLPSAGSLEGRIITVKKVDNSANYVIIEGYQGETIDGTTSQTIQFQWTSLRLQSTGSEWVIM